MIKEITKFVETIPIEYFSNNLQLKEGLYIFLDIEEGENGEALLKNVNSEGNILPEDYAVYDKNSDDTPFFKKCLDWSQFIEPTSSNKAFNRKFFVLTANPFCIAFKKEFFFREDRHNEDTFIKSLDEFFKNSKKYYEDNFGAQIHLFKIYLKKNLWTFLLDFKPFLEMANKNVYVFFKNTNFNDFIKVYEQYLELNIFNKPDFTETYQEQNFGVSDNLSGFNDKKLFLQHKTALSGVSYRVDQREAQLLWKFFQMQSNRQLPNPLPIFVDKEERLNKNVVSLHQSGEVVGYTEIVKRLVQLEDRDLQNFYLIFFDVRSKKSKIIDIDFVPLFKYKIKGLKLHEVFDLKGTFEKSISDVFQLQYEVFNKIFNGHLVSERKDGGLWLKYFDEIEANPKYGLTDTIVHLMHQFRKAFYDYIYKSRRQAITCEVFDEMMIKSILDDIRHDEEFNKHNRIKEKLNIWFNLFSFFSQNKNRIDMANRTFELRETLKRIIENESQYIQTDDEFAFASGQVIWRVLVQSKSSNKSHALLEPFLQKTNAGEFKRAIARSFDTYKHEFKLYPVKYGFDKLMAEVMGFEPSEKNMKNHLPMILAGYFSQSLFNQEKEVENQ